MKKRIFTFSLLLVMANSLVAAEKFYPDDPLQKEPPPRNAANVKTRELDQYYDMLENSFAERGERNKKGHIVPAQGVNTLGEPIDPAWYNPRHYFKPMSEEELVRGSGGNNPPSAGGSWTVVSAKNEGISPGFVMTDDKGDRYFVKFDPKTNPEMATGAEMISARLFHALGYNVPDNYLISVTRERLVVGSNVTIIDTEGRKRRMNNGDLDKLLAKVPKTGNGQYRAIASIQIPGKPVGPFKYFGTRPDDPNDVVPHEHRRDLRGLFVFCAWLNHNDSRAINNFDALVAEGSTQYVRHYLQDLGATLGSASTFAKPAARGGEYYLDFKEAPKQMVTFGLAVPYWARAKFPDNRAVGGFDSAAFRPDQWIPDYPNSAFLNRLPDDDFWAAKQVMAFSDEQIRAVVKVAQFSDPRAEKYVADTIIARRDKIGKTFFPKVLPLDRFAIENGKLVFRDLAQEHGFDVKGPLRVAWSRFDNQTQQKTPIPGAQDFQVPDNGNSSYLAADIWRGDDSKKTVTVYLRVASVPKVVGVDRTW
jgi:hypothetical protein